MAKTKGTFSERLNLASLYQNQDEESEKNLLSTYRKSLYEKPYETQEKPILLSSKLKDGRLRGYLNYKSTQDMLNSVQEQYIRLHEQDLDAKAVVKPGFEKDNIPEKKIIKTKGKGWFNFPENESKEVEKDYLVIQMRNALDPKRFYKKPEHKSGVPKFVQVGTVVSDAHNYYDRATKAERKPTLVEEMLTSFESKKKIKKRFRAVAPMFTKKIKRKSNIKQQKSRNDTKKRRTKGRNNK